MLCLILLTLCFRKRFKLIFSLVFKFSEAVSSWPKTMYAELWRKLALTTLLGTSPILLVQQFCGALINGCLPEYATVFPIKNKF